MLALLAVPSLGGCSTNAATGRSQFILLSADSVRQMGEEARDDVLAQNGGEVDSPELRAYVREVGLALLANVEPEYRDLDWEFLVADADILNAFALPGGKVFITTGLLSTFANEAEIAGVLGHEIGHVTARHVDERLSSALVAQVGLAVLDASTDSELVVLGSNLLTQGALLKFSRAQESESDRLGVRYMVAAGYDPVGMRMVLEVLRDAAAGGGTPEMLSTHPDPGRRVNDVQGLIDGPYAETQGSPAYGLRETRFERRGLPFLN